MLDETRQALAVSPVTNASSPTGLGKSLLKRRKTVDDNSDEKAEETLVLVKKRRTTEDGVSKKTDLWAKMDSYKLPLPVQNTAIPAPSPTSNISSMSRESSQSPSPLPPSPLPLERTEKDFSTSPMAPSLSLPTPSGTPLAEDRIPPVPPSLMVETRNITPVATSIEVTSANGQLINPITVESLSSWKPCINQMHRSGFSPEDIQKAFKKRHEIDLSYEIIQSVITDCSGSMPPETPSCPLSSIAPITRQWSRSSSTTASPIPGIKHESPLHESLQESSLVTRSSNIFIPLDDLSVEQGLKALESLQLLLPEKIEQLRLKVQEEQAEKERLRREEEDEIVKKRLAVVRREIDKLDEMKRGDALEMLNKEIEQKRLGWVFLLLDRH